VESTHDRITYKNTQNVKQILYNVVKLAQKNSRPSPINTHLFNPLNYLF